MESLTFKTLESDKEIKLYLDKIEYYTNVRLPESYAKSSKIVGAFLHNKLAGGYMIITRPAFRSLLFVPDRVKNSHDFFKNDIHEMLEVNGVWIGPAVRTPKMQYSIWIKLILDVFFAKKKYLLLMSNVRNRNIEHLHSLSNPEILYEGAPNLMAGENSHSKIRVSYTTRWKAILNIPKYWMELRDRERRAKEFGAHKVFPRGLSINTD